MKQILALLFLISFFTNAQTGIGTTTPAVKLHVKSNGSIFRLEGSDHAYMELYPQGSSTRYGYLGYPGVSLTTLTLMNQFSAGLLAFGTNNTNRMWLNSDGNVGIGTPNPSTRLHIYDSDNTGWWTGLLLDGNAAASGTQINMRNNNDKEWHIDLLGSSGSNPNSLNFWNSVSGSNALSLSTDGKVNINTSSNSSLDITANTSDNNGMINLNANTNQNWENGWHEFIRFYNQGTVIGEIKQTNASTIAYNTTSDYRLKFDFKPFNGMDLLRKMKPYDYAWKVDSSRMYGFKAHELQEVIPYIVAGEKDAVDKDGKIIPQTVDYSKLTPILVKAILEQDVKILQLEKDKESLELRIYNLEKLIIEKIK